jgi:hypothetical protein
MTSEVKVQRALLIDREVSACRSALSATITTEELEQ